VKIHDFYKSAILAFADGRFNAISEEMANQMKNMPAVGVYGDDFQQRTLWGEYRLAITRDIGGSLKWIWHETLNQILKPIIDNLALAERRLLALYTDPCQNLMLEAAENYEEAYEEAKKYNDGHPDPVDFLTIPVDDDWLSAEILGRICLLAETDNLLAEERTDFYEDSDNSKPKDEG
jgi:hypothetical protein